MSAFVTHATDEQLRVALVDIPSWLAKPLERHFLKQGLDVSVIDKHTFTDITPLAKNTDHPDRWYKVIIGVDWSNDESDDVSLSRMFSSIGAKNWQVIANWDSSQDYRIRLRELEVIQTQLRVKQQLFLCRDVITPDALPSFITELCGRIQSDRTLGMSTQKTKLQTHQALVDAVLETIDIPVKNEIVVVEGQERSLDTLLSKLKTRYEHVYDCTLEEQLTQLDFTPVSREISHRQTSKDTYQRLVSALLQQLPSVTQAQATVTLPKPQKEVVMETRQADESATIAVPQAISTPVEAQEKPTISEPMESEIEANEIRKKTLHEKLNNIDISSNIEDNDEGRIIAQEVEKQVISATEENQSQLDPSIKQAIQNQVQQMFKQYRVVDKTEHLQEQVKTTKKITGKNTKKRFVFGLGVGVVSVAVAIISFFGWVVWSQQQLSSAVFQVAETGLNEDLEAKIARQIEAVQWQIDTFDEVVPPTFFADSYGLVEIGQNVIGLSEKIATVQQQQETQFSQIMGMDTSTFQDFNNQELIEQLYVDLSRLQSRLEVFADQLEGNSYSQAQDYIQHLAEQRAGLLVYQQFNQVLPQLVGLEGRQTYALVFQNDQELRPQGGIAQAIALVTFEAGTVSDIQVLSVDQLDQNLPAILEPPELLESFTAVDRLLIRDSLWSPDTEEASQQLLVLLEEVVPQQINGVVLLNSQFLTDALEQVGPLELPTYNEVITHKNLWDRLEFHSEIQVADASQSSEYTRALFEAFLQKLVVTPPEHRRALLGAIGASLDGHFMNIWFENTDLQTTIETLGWSGQVITPACPSRFATQPCVVDRLMVLDANIGANKANYHVDRSEQHQVVLSPTQVRHTHTITLKNTGTSNAWPQGLYRSLLRVFVPSKASLQTLKVNGQDFPEESYVITNYPDQELAELSLPTQTAIQSETVIEITYSYAWQQADPFSYSFFYRQQPGIDQPLSSVSISFDPSWVPTLIAPQASVVDSSVLYPITKTGHFFGAISFN